MSKNKYHLRAIRSELDLCVRHSSWKKFRSRFDGLDDELKAAVVEYRPTSGTTSSGGGSSVRPKRSKSSSSLLHSLCHCVHANPPVPVDIVESIVLVCPHLLSGNPHQPTPLSIALDRQASPAVVEALLMHDTTRQSLYRPDGKGDTPLLQAIKNEANDEVLNMLMDYDNTKESLLIPSKKRQKVPLFYVVHQELAHVNLDTEADLPGEVEYMLLATYEALQMQTNAVDLIQMMLDSSQIEDEEQDTNAITTTPLTGKQASSDAFFDENASFSSSQDDEDYDLESAVFDDVQDKHWVSLLHATLACAHFLGDKYAVSLVYYFLDKVQHLETASMLDDHGNTPLHQVCMSPHMFHASSSINGRLLLDVLLERHPATVTTRNTAGKLPLHLALETQKPWRTVIKSLIEVAPLTVQESVKTSSSSSLPSSASVTVGRLPLQIAVQSYPSMDVAIRQVWMRYPEALAMEDPIEYLYPFQLAATPKTNTILLTESHPAPLSKKAPKNQRSRTRKSDSKQEETDLHQLSDIFFFLRASPEVLKARN